MPTTILETMTSPRSWYVVLDPDARPSPPDNENRREERRGSRDRNPPRGRPPRRLRNPHSRRPRDLVSGVSIGKLHPRDGDQLARRVDGERPDERGRRHEDNREDGQEQESHAPWTARTRARLAADFAHRFEHELQPSLHALDADALVVMMGRRLLDLAHRTRT